MKGRFVFDLKYAANEFPLKTYAIIGSERGIECDIEGTVYIFSSELYAALRKTADANSNDSLSSDILCRPYLFYRKDQGNIKSKYPLSCWTEYRNEKCCLFLDLCATGTLVNASSMMKKNVHVIPFSSDETDFEFYARTVTNEKAIEEVKTWEAVYI